MPDFRANSISAALLPTPEKMVLSARPPAARTRASSPPDTMSKPLPSSAKRRMTLRLPLASIGGVIEKSVVIADEVKEKGCDVINNVVDKAQDAFSKTRKIQNFEQEEDEETGFNEFADDKFTDADDDEKNDGSEEK